LDFVGDEKYELFFKNLETGELLSETIKDISSSFEWANEDRTIFYDVLDDINRPFKIMKHELGSSKEDEDIYQENDKKFEVSLSKTNDDQYILIESESSLTSEIRYIDANEPKECFLLCEREYRVKYHIEHFKGIIFIISNHQGYTNFGLWYTTLLKKEKCYWKECMPYDKEHYLEFIIPYAHSLALIERCHGLRQIRLLHWDFSTMQITLIKNVSFPDPVYSFFIDPEQNYQDNLIRLTYSSLVIPEIVYDYDIIHQDWKVIKRKEVLGEFDSTSYTVERIFAQTSDSISIPISLVYKTCLKKNGENPTLLYGYGSYSISIDPSFSYTRLSYLNRGFIYAIAHVRGGGDNGRIWYEEGKLLKKKNTFHDFIACAEALIRQGYTKPEKLAIEGRSAGGLLMGSMICSRPDLFKVVLGT
jgi:oligopeptidase B